MLGLIASWVIFAILVGVWAMTWGRNVLTWCLFALFLSPPIAGLCLFVAGRSDKRCPKCTKRSLRLAAECDYCGHKFA